MSDGVEQHQIGSASRGALLIVLTLAGLAGAAGVTLSAAAAHRVESPALATAATLLIIHAVAAVAILAHAARRANAGVWVATAAFMLAGAALFSGDIAANTLGGFHLFPMAAPTGGSALIASWIVVAALAFVAFLRER